MKSGKVRYRKESHGKYVVTANGKRTEFENSGHAKRHFKSLKTKEVNSGTNAAESNAADRMVRGDVSDRCVVDETAKPVGAGAGEVHTDAPREGNL